eukprot:2563631-Pleurochrysis_carterae.AAC.1
MRHERLTEDSGGTRSASVMGMRRSESARARARARTRAGAMTRSRSTARAREREQACSAGACVGRGCLAMCPPPARTTRTERLEARAHARACGGARVHCAGGAASRRRMQLSMLASRRWSCEYW